MTTRRGVERAIRYAFEYAKKFGRKKVTLVAKTNVLRFAHQPRIRAFEQVKGDYSGIETDYHHVDACTMYMVTKPKIYDVIVTTNMSATSSRTWGAIQGGMELRASGTSIPRARPPACSSRCTARPPTSPVKGSPPHRHFLSVAMMPRFPRPDRSAKAINAACARVVADKKITHATSAEALPRPGRRRGIRAALIMLPRETVMAEVLRSIWLYHADPSRVRSG